MPRKLRVEYPGAIYHVMNHGDCREPSFRDHADRQRFGDFTPAAVFFPAGKVSANPAGFPPDTLGRYSDE